MLLQHLDAPGMWALGIAVRGAHKLIRVVAQRRFAKKFVPSLLRAANDRVCSGCYAGPALLDALAAATVRDEDRVPYYWVTADVCLRSPAFALSMVSLSKLDNALHMLCVYDVHVSTASQVAAVIRVLPTCGRVFTLGTTCTEILLTTICNTTAARVALVTMMPTFMGGPHVWFPYLWAIGDVEAVAATAQSPDVAGNAKVGRLVWRAIQARTYTGTAACLHAAQCVLHINAHVMPATTELHLLRLLSALLSHCKAADDAAATMIDQLVHTVMVPAYARAHGTAVPAMRHVWHMLVGLSVAEHVSVYVASRMRGVYLPRFAGWYDMASTALAECPDACSVRACRVFLMDLVPVGKRAVVRAAADNRMDDI